MNDAHQGDAVRVLSWNIHRNYRADTVETSLRRLLSEHAPDVVLLQEAPVYADRRFADHALFEGWHSAYAPAHVIHAPARRLSFESTGQLTLSRKPVAETDTCALPVLPSRTTARSQRRGIVRRNAVYARLPWGEDGLGVFNVHLENRAGPAGRLRQTQALLACAAERADAVTVLGGDFNTFLGRRWEAAIHLIERAGFTNPLRGRRALLPRLDYVFVRGARRVTARPLRARGSDHGPVLARIER